ncbi:hypothetical protein EK21DRAFT_116165 [Setomelanomma holmii]|uniref:Uncharacterized protein n=1 Tax=Setomelanomma holmii TaxID=210430 RepID=A0A9P4LI23_9PLEO|nr:hypothetical protein EK21DRAFT_116165 [Setomelanomma holmii]
MHFATILITTLPTATLAVDIYQYTGSDCNGMGYRCAFIPFNTCCCDFSNPRDLGSLQIRQRSDHYGNAAALFRKDGDKLCGTFFEYTELNLACSRPKAGGTFGGTAALQIPDNSVVDADARDLEVKTCENTMVGDAVYTAGGTTYVISNGKTEGLAEMGLSMPNTDIELLKYFMMHADEVIDMGSGR